MIATGTLAAGLAAILAACLPVLLKFFSDQKETKESDERKIETAPDTPPARMARLRQRLRDLRKTAPPK